MNNKINLNLIAAVVLILIAASTRFIDSGMPNFTPIMAIALFGGAIFKDIRYAFGIPIAAMLLSDLFIGFYDIYVMIAVYLSFAVAVMIGRSLTSNGGFLKLTFTSLSSALIFFVVTNFAVWAFFPYYTKDLPGLALCYEMAIPFIRTWTYAPAESFFLNTVFSTLIFSYTMFGAYKFAEKYLPEAQLQTVNKEIK